MGRFLSGRAGKSLAGVHLFARFGLAFLFIAAVAPVAGAAEPAVVRTWTSADGKFSTRGELLDRDEKSIKLRNDAGREVTVPLSRLCKEDLEFLKTLAKADAKKKSAAKGKSPTKTTAKKPTVGDAKGDIAKADKKKSPSAPPTEISRCKDFEEFKTLLSKAFGEKKYDLLEATQRALVSDDSTFTEFSVRPKLEVFYGALAKAPIGKLGVAMPFDEAINDWVKTNPKSKTALLVATQFEINAAWSARGSGPGSSVTEQGAQIFADRIERARIILSKASDLDGDDPDFYRQLFIVARAQSWDWKSATPFYLELMRKFPEYPAAHIHVATMLMPRWGGEEGQMEQQTAATADKIGGAKGDEIYAQVVGEMLMYHRQRIFEETKFDYERAIRGFDSILGRYPDASVFLQQAGYIAALKNDVSRAGKYFLGLSKAKFGGPAKFWSNEAQLKETARRSIAAMEKKAGGPLFAVADARTAPSNMPGPPMVRVIPQQFQRAELLPPGAPLPEETAWKSQATPLTVNDTGVRLLRFLPASRFLIAASVTGNELSVWDCQNGYHKKIDLPAHAAKDQTLSIAVDARRENVFVRCRSNGNATQLWNFRLSDDPSGGLPTLKVTQSGAGPGANPFVHFAHSGQFYVQDAMNAGANLMVFTAEGVRNGAAVLFRCESQPAVAAAISADSKFVACAFANGKLQIGSVDQLLEPTFKPENVVIGASEIKDMCFADGGKILCCAEPTGVVHLIDVAQKAIIAKLQAPGALKQIDIHPGGRLLASAHGDSHCVCLWDVVARKEVKRLTGHTGDVNTVSFATNGKVLASGSQDGTIRLWDVPKTP